MAGGTRRGLFGPLVLAGLGSAALTAVAGTKQMVRADEGSLTDLGVPAEAVNRLDPDSEIAGLGAAGATVSGDLPLVGALALVVLACWGVLLVTRGRARVAVAVLTLLASAGTLAAAVAGLLSRTDSYARDVVDQLGLAPSAADQVAVDPTGWFWAACVGAVLQVAVAAVALPRVRLWPAMGGRYDAPGANSGRGTPPAEEQSNLDLWQAMDRGDDPTA